MAVTSCRGAFQNQNSRYTPTNVPILCCRSHYNRLMGIDGQWGRHGTAGARKIARATQSHRQTTGTPPPRSVKRQRETNDKTGETFLVADISQSLYAASLVVYCFRWCIFQLVFRFFYAALDKCVPMFRVSQFLPFFPPLPRPISVGGTSPMSHQWDYRCQAG